MADEKSTIRVTRKALAFFAALREAKKERFGINYSNDILLEEIIAMILSDAELEAKVIGASPGSHKEAKTINL